MFNVAIKTIDQHVRKKKYVIHIVLMSLFLNGLHNRQAYRGVLREKCSENMQQTYRRTFMLECDFNKVAKQRDASVSYEYCLYYYLKHVFVS